MNCNTLFDIHHLLSSRAQHPTRQSTLQLAQPDSLHIPSRLLRSPTPHRTIEDGRPDGVFRIIAPRRNRTYRRRPNLLPRLDPHQRESPCHRSRPRPIPHAPRLPRVQSTRQHRTSALPIQHSTQRTPSSPGQQCPTHHPNTHTPPSPITTPQLSRPPPSPSPSSSLPHPSPLNLHHPLPTHPSTRLLPARPRARSFTYESAGAGGGECDHGG